jgi:hypothetical protein
MASGELGATANGELGKNELDILFVYGRLDVLFV